jgi:hypothetical protein
MSFVIIIGLVYKKGKFSSVEEHQLSSAIENYRVVSYTSLVKLTDEIITGMQLKQLTHEQLDDVIFAKEKSKDNAFWSEISAYSSFPIIAIS